MTTHQNAANGAVQAELCPNTATNPQWDMEDLATEALSIGLAVDWIVQANAVLEDIRITASIYPEFRTMLHDRSVAYNSADWLACEMDQFISRILSRQHILIKRMAGGAV